jgi:hypothetical protein
MPKVSLKKFRKREKIVDLPIIIETNYAAPGISNPFSGTKGFVRTD